MFPRRRYTTRPRKVGAKKRAQVKKALGPKARQAVATIAKRVIDRTSETKYVARTPVAGWTGVYGHVLPTGGTPQLYGCVPQIAPGSDSFQRDGLKISPVKHRTDLRFAFNPDALISTPDGNVSVARAGWDITVHIWYGYVKRFRNIADIETTALATSVVSQMLDDGEGGLQPWEGVLVDENLRTNKEFVSLRHKKVRMYKNAGLANVLDTTSPALGTPMSEAKRVSLVFKPPKMLEYKDEEQLFPENYAPFYIVGYCHNDTTPASYIVNAGPTADPTRIPAIVVHQTDHMWFKDH